MACVGTYVCPQISENQSDEEERFKENIVRLHNVIRSVRLPRYSFVCSSRKALLDCTIHNGYRAGIEPFHQIDCF